MKNQKIKAFKVKLPIPINSFNQSIGIDPGTTHLGVAIIEGYLDNPYIYAFQIEMKRDENPINRIRIVQDSLSECINWYHMPNYAVIEGASYYPPYRQVELAEIRTAAALWCLGKGFETFIIPPKTIRKKVFGSGKILPHEEWIGLPSDATQAIACAYFPLVDKGL